MMPPTMTESKTAPRAPLQTSAPRASAAPITSSNGSLDHPRNYLGHRFVYVKFSPRAHGLSVGVNLNRDAACNFDCVYCDVARAVASQPAEVDLDVLAAELRETLEWVRSGEIAEKLRSCRLPAALLKLRMVAISGEGEPTLSPQFVEAVETIVHVRAQGRFPYFKIALLTNGSTLGEPRVQAGLRYLTREDEIWVKLDAGTAACFERINRPGGCRIEDVIANILSVARQRPVIIQSLFPLFRNEPPSVNEIDTYAQRLNELKSGGAQISLVQVYSVSRTPARAGCAHLPLRNLSQIARTVREATGLNVEVF